MLRLVLGTVLVMFVPGFLWSWVLFRKGQLTWLERFVLSVGMSIAIVVILLLALNVLLNLAVTTLNAVITTITISVIPLVILAIKHFSKRQSINTEPPPES